MLLAPSRSDLKTALAELERITREWGMVINYPKTEAVVFGLPAAATSCGHGGRGAGPKCCQGYDDQGSGCLVEGKGCCNGGHGSKDSPWRVWWQGAQQRGGLWEATSSQPLPMHLPPPLPR